MKAGEANAPTFENPQQISNLPLIEVLLIPLLISTVDGLVPLEDGGDDRCSGFYDVVGCLAKFNPQTRCQSIFFRLAGARRWRVSYNLVIQSPLLI
jgi:hypothetical protein